MEERHLMADHRGPNARQLVFAASVILGSTCPALASNLSCVAGDVRVSVNISPMGCQVDDHPTRLDTYGDPTICHVSLPELRVLTLYPDGQFTWKDPAEDTVVTGKCRPS